MGEIILFERKTTCELKKVRKPFFFRYRRIQTSNFLRGPAVPTSLSGCQLCTYVLASWAAIAWALLTNWIRSQRLKEAY